MEKSDTKVIFNKETYDTLLQRYKELQKPRGGASVESIPYDIDSSITELETKRIDSNYLDSHFKKYIKTLEQKNVTEEEKQKVLDEFHKSFASLSQEEQKFAEMLLFYIQCNNIDLQKGNNFSDYLAEYMTLAYNDKISKISSAFALDEKLLREIMYSNVAEANLNECGRFDKLKETVDYEKAKEYFEKKEAGIKLTASTIRRKVDKLLRDFIFSAGFDIDKN